MWFSQPRPRQIYSPAPRTGSGRVWANGGFVGFILWTTLAVWPVGCGATRDPNLRLDSGPSTTLSPPNWPDGGPMFCGEAKQPLSFLPKAVDLLVMFDRSGSMSRGFGTTTRFEAAQGLLGEVAWAYQDRIRFGYQQFPTPGGCGEGSSASACCAQAPLVPLGPFSADPLVRAMAAAAPVDGNTPTAQALSLAAAYFATVNDGVGERYVLLSTDGEPSCLAEGGLAKDLVRSGQRIEGPCVDALAAVAQLRAAGIKVIVLGIGSDLVLGEQGAPSCLEDLARAGGVAREGTGGPAFFSATDPKELERALQRIFGAVIQPSCVVAMSKPAPNPANVSVFFDGEQVPFDQSKAAGWQWVEGKEGQVLQVFGKHCQRLERLQVQQVDVGYGCPPCTSAGSCQ